MPWPASCSASSRIWLVIELTCQTVVIRLPALAGFGTRVHTIPDALATSIAATRSTICSCSSTSTCWPDCWPDGTDRPPHRIGSQMGCPGARWDTETLTGVLVATVRDPADRPRRQTDSRPQAVKDTSASAGSHPIFTPARRPPQGLTRLKRKSPVYQQALPRESRAWPGMPDSHPSWRPQAMGVLSAITGLPPCNRALLQVVRDRTRRSNAFLRLVSIATRHSSCGQYARSTATATGRRVHLSKR